ncbi:Gfo/Idh/MocA family oxidoreductase [Winogradskyella maritima]|nr:Gfo/Idh/MocA family oxidoreductase [Winogradskyella maritima]
MKKRYTDYDELLKDPDIDAVHINTPIPDHGIQSIKALKAGKHVACTVPMATTVEECEEIVRLTEETGLTYMMMETVVYAREFLYMKELYDNGELGKVQFFKGESSTGYGWVAQLLARITAYALRNSLCRTCIGFNQR